MPRHPEHRVDHWILRFNKNRILLLNGIYKPQNNDATCQLKEVSSYSTT